jgi:putative endonuclease
LSRNLKGNKAHYSGLAAENKIAKAYRAGGYHLEAQLWRSLAGEIDLIFKTWVCCVFVEVKKSQNHERAAQLLTACQRRHIIAAARVFMVQVRSATCMAMRFDLALIERFDAILIVENVFFQSIFRNHQRWVLFSRLKL